MSNKIKLHIVTEHHGYPHGADIEIQSDRYRSNVPFQFGDNRNCYEIEDNGNKRKLKTFYFIGVDWIREGEMALQVEPKIDSDSQKTDFLKLLTHAFKHPDVMKHTGKLYTIHFGKPPISISQKDDYLSPLLVIQYLHVLKDIVRKGLKKTYNSTEKNLSSKVKGKIMIGQSIKRNQFKNQPHKTYCNFDEFDVNGVENRILKRALLVGKQYVEQMKIPLDLNLLNYISPAFENVSSNVRSRELQHARTNPFYKEYGDGLELAKLILKRFGYNVNSTKVETEIQTPPFWIDMSALFELYVLGLLKDRFGSSVIYHFKRNYNELDYLLKSDDYTLVIDAKYKPRYENSYLIQDIRQLSGYARLSEVYKELGVEYPTSIDCLIIYPDQENGHTDLMHVDLIEVPIQNFKGFYKLDVKLPIQEYD